MSDHFEQVKTDILKRTAENGGPTPDIPDTLGNPWDKRPTGHTSGPVGNK